MRLLSFYKMLSMQSRELHGDQNLSPYPPCNTNFVPIFNRPHQFYSKNSPSPPISKKSPHPHPVPAYVFLIAAFPASIFLDELSSKNDILHILINSKNDHTCGRQWLDTYRNTRPPPLDPRTAETNAQRKLRCYRQQRRSNNRR